MDKLILTDGTEIEIHDGASLSAITTDVEDYTALGLLAEKLNKENLKNVTFVIEQKNEFFYDEWPLYDEVTEIDNDPEITHDEENLANDEYALDNTEVIEDDTPKFINGLYENMILSEPHFSVTNKGDHLEVVFGIRELTADEIKEPSVLMAIAYLSDEQALTVKMLYPKWDKNGTYNTGDRCLYNDILYKCLQTHNAQDDWTPDVAHSLWAKILVDPSGSVAEWEQPDSTNAYMKGDKVIHNGKSWESLVDNNVWEPGTVGTENLWKEIV